jgi:hypothetical protein
LRSVFKLDRNSDNKLSRPEFLVIVNWLFQLASSPHELALGDVERACPHPFRQQPRASRPARRQRREGASKTQEVPRRDLPCAADFTLSSQASPRGMNARACDWVQRP